MKLHLHSISFIKGHRVLLAFLVLHTLITCWYASSLPLTTDEPGYIEYSKRWLKGHPERVQDVDDSKTPLTAVAWIPRMVKQLLHPGYTQNDWGRSDQLAGRYAMFLFFWLVVIYTYLWARSLYGKDGWWLPVLLLCIDPAFMAYTPVVGSDIISVWVILACCYHYYQWCSTNLQKHMFICAIMAGVACITKASLLFIPLVLFSIYLVRLVSGTVRFRKEQLLYAFLFIGIVWLVLNAGFYFTGTLKTWGSIHFKSDFFKTLMGTFGFLQNIPILLPEPFIQGVDMLQYHKAVGPFMPDMPYKGVFVLGHKFTHGVWYYYLLTCLFKIPIGILILLASAVIVCGLRFKASKFYEKYVFIILPLAVYAVLLSFFNPFQSGIRHTLIIMPFWYLGVGYIVVYVKRHKANNIKWMYALLAYALVSVAFQFRDVMHYSNEIILPKQKIFHYLAEYNYVQADIPKDVAPFLKEHSDYVIAPVKPATGKFIIPGAYVYNSTYEVYPSYQWLQAYEPVGCYRNVFLVYDIPANR